MGLLDFLKKGENKKKKQAPTMGGASPFFTPFGENIYASDIIVQSIRCTANEFKKLEPRHITVIDGMKTTVNDSSIARVLKRPNDWMTTADFLEKIKILLELNKNVFIYPQYQINGSGKKYYTGLYPLKPTFVEYRVDERNKLYIYMRFTNNYETTLPASDVIHWRKDYGVNDYFGGGMFGGNDNTGLLKMLKRYDQITQGIAKALEISCKINGIAKFNSYLGDDELQKNIDDFNKKLENNESGILPTDMSTEYTNIPRDVKLVDSETIKFFYEIILREQGTSLAILNGDYTKSQKEAFYEHALEPHIISLGQAFTKTMITDRELSFGNEIVFFPKAINFMSMENKIQAMRVTSPAGVFMKDEIREIFGYPPLPDKQGQVIAQGYNSLLDENNNNKLKSEGKNND